MQSIGRTLFSEEQKYRARGNTGMIEMKDGKVSVHGEYQYQELVEKEYLPSYQDPVVQIQSGSQPTNKKQMKQIPAALNAPTYSIPNVPYQNPYYTAGKDDMVLNGKKLKIVQKDQESKKKPVPPRQKKNMPNMPVTCVFCMKDQNVEGTSEDYVCYHCGNKNGCTPMYNIVRCTNCNVKVCYRYFTSDLVKCTKCSYVNKVPKWASNAKIPAEIPRQEQRRNMMEEEKSVEYLIEYPDLISENGDEIRTGRY